MIVPCVFTESDIIYLYFISQKEMTSSSRLNFLGYSLRDSLIFFRLYFFFLVEFSQNTYYHNCWIYKIGKS